MHPLPEAVVAYAIASGWESIGHRHILHAPHRRAMGWHRYGAMGKALREARFNHLIHHQLASRGSALKRQIQQSQRLSRGVVEQLEETDFGATIHPTPGAYLLFSGVPLVLTVLFDLAVDPASLPLGVVIALTPYLMTRYIHPLLHHRSTGLKTTPTPLGARPLEWAFTLLRAYHDEHHHQPGRNFNLLPGADQLFAIIRHVWQAAKSMGNNGVVRDSNV